MCALIKAFREYRRQNIREGVQFTGHKLHVCAPPRLPQPRCQPPRCMPLPGAIAASYRRGAPARGAASACAAMPRVRGSWLASTAAVARSLLCAPRKPRKQVITGEEFASRRGCSYQQFIGSNTHYPRFRAVMRPSPLASMASRLISTNPAALSHLWCSRSV